VSFSDFTLGVNKEGIIYKKKNKYFQYPIDKGGKIWYTDNAK
jgi:hypothetical protein